MVESRSDQQIGYLLRSYPRLSQTFILNEILALEQIGVSIQIFALTNPHEKVVQIQVDQVRAPVHYLDEAGQPRRFRQDAKGESGSSQTAISRDISMPYFMSRPLKGSMRAIPPATAGDVFFRLFTLSYALLLSEQRTSKKTKSPACPFCT